MTKTMERVATEVVVRPDTYKTILVHAEPGIAATHRVEVAARLARDLDARLIGLGAETYEPIVTSDPYSGYASGELIAMLQEQVARRLTEAETAFRRDAAGASIDWRSVQDYPSRALVQAARTCDLIVVSPKESGDTTRATDAADVVMSAGRPVLIVPEDRHHLRAMGVVVAWKDTRECRRALDDAMPLLQRAEDVIVHAVCKADEADRMVFEVDDVVENLKRHGVEARGLVTSVAPEGVTQEIERVAQLNNADLIVCGAYGHSRLREWAFGGVTDDLMHRPTCFVLMSH
ncbi:MAG: universal stress protein [Phenylobacterium sp.]|uniref:universal stress protein n=1 Tax=Phenylobacterium sp. TaxID=1871053 RepID=UPI0011FFCA91|nr:universal stress protein [Phenylobacterium sp.]TAJ71999.1 MAG: universal stress protein [Phenylobacterium sp.]